MPAARKSTSSSQGEPTASMSLQAASVDRVRPHPPVHDEEQRFSAEGCIIITTFAYKAVALGCGSHCSPQALSSLCIKSTDLSSPVKA